MLELEVASLAAIFALGLRHGFDPDHLAAIGDLVGSQIRARRAILLATAYALGHAATVFVLSAAAALAGGSIPDSIVSVTDEIVGVSLVLMGVYLLYSLGRWGSRARLQSRWSLLTTAVGRLFGRRSASFIEIEHDHHHETDPSHGHVHTQSDVTASPAAPVVTTAAHRHRHRHVLPVPTDPLPVRGVAASLGIGVLHGIGAETPSQILLLAAAAGRGYSALLLAGIFVAGLLVSNTLVAIAGALGLGWLRQGSRLYMAVILLAATFSLVVGAGYLVSD